MSEHTENGGARSAAAGTSRSVAPGSAVAENDVGRGDAPADATAEKPSLPKRQSRSARAATRGSAEAFDPVRIGARVRALRESSGLSLRDLAARSGVSAPMLSQVERGETSPTLSVAGRIAAGLDLRLSQLLRLDEQGAVTVVRTADRRHGGSAKRGHRFEVLTPEWPGQRLELSLHRLAPDGATGAPDDPPMHEPGSRESVYVQAGRLLFHCDGGQHELQAGDCVTFDADLPHRFESRGGGEALFLAVLAAGLRRS